MGHVTRLFPFAILAAGGCAPTGPPTGPPAVPRWPAVEEVAHVRAEVLAGPYQDTAIPEFELPAEYATAVVRALAPPRYVDHPRMVPRVVGRVRVTLRDGSAVAADLLDGEANPIKSPATFAVGGVPCIRDGPYRGLVQRAGQAGGRLIARPAAVRPCGEARPTRRTRRGCPAVLEAAAVYEPPEVKPR